MKDIFTVKGYKYCCTNVLVLLCYCTSISNRRVTTYTLVFRILHYCLIKCTCINITSVLRFATDIIIRNNRKSSLALNGKNEFCITKKLSASSLSFTTIIWANRARPARQRATTSYVLSLLSHCYCCCEIGAET